MKKKLTLAILVAASANAAVAGPIEEQIRFRQSAYSFAAWNISKIKSQVVDHPETFNKDSVAAAANAIAAVANSGLGALYGEGTDKGVGWKETRLKPEFFQKKEEVTVAANTFNVAANELAKVAATGDVSAIKTQFGKVGESCKSCHDLIRIKE
ncbi:c-type cytochrome [Methylobacter tundripaludum]|uniref:Cytochrome c prime n=1 Tax=Methylobacter tundripaludum (strain ATCC BAA-1195 / DSM 17260 / SV96) TaxID=697282 RepID=G3IXJ7_METTV|nr:cytochrome c [Methylobacter tundripaludum]EGW23406.1 cytochrome c prime [Methylobacter tundripaludum SV96]